MSWENLIGGNDLLGVGATCGLVDPTLFANEYPTGNPNQGQYISNASVPNTFVLGDLRINANPTRTITLAVGGMQITYYNITPPGGGFKILSGSSEALSCSPNSSYWEGDKPYLVCGIDEENHLGKVGLLFRYQTGAPGGFTDWVCYWTPNAKDGEMYAWLKGNISPLITYHWSSVPAISGQMGIISLTMIENDKIEEGAGGLTDLPETNITRFTDQTNIRRLCLNFTKNEWHRVAESGLNYLELKYDFYTVTGITALLVDFRFVNHYGEGNNQYYSTVYTGQLPLGLQTSGNYDQYLAFIIDEENEVAQFDPVTWCRDYVHVPPITGVRYGYFSPTEQEMAALYYFLKGSPEEIDEDDPYADGSEGDGGDSNPYQPQDHIGLSSKPTKSGLNLGIVTLYKPDETEVALIADFLWSDDVLDNFKKYFNNFADNLMSFYVLPVTPEAAGVSTKPFKVGNMTSDDAGLQAVDYITDRYVDIDMGSFYLKRKWDSYLDVSPYTKLEVYLPYCGTHQLNTDEIVYPANMDGFLPVKPDQEIKLELNYRVDLVTGNIVATLLVNGENRYQFTGKCGMTIPLTGANYQNMVSGAITAGAGLAATIASGGLTAPLTASAAVSGTVMAQKPEVYRSGNLSGDVSMLAYDTPYLIKTIPNKPEIKNQELYTGYPSYKKATLGSFSGYTEVIEAHIDDVSCSSEEKDKIMAALKGGVII